MRTNESKYSPRQDCVLIVFVGERSRQPSSVAGCCEVGTGIARPSPARKQERARCRPIDVALMLWKGGRGREGWERKVGTKKAGKKKVAQKKVTKKKVAETGNKTSRA
ncbi:hypothetical protein MHU86_21449 [Fragilaria crotonensis]|nr:hypothetical protein MHU86_21449 [Fragilaria crotonensis]